jgi:hypothetical protein
MKGDDVMATKTTASNKRLWHLLPVEALEETIKVLEFGAKNRGENEWRTPPYFTRETITDALKRHQAEIDKGNLTDTESGLLHGAHIVCCALFQLQYDLKGWFQPSLPDSETSVKRLKGAVDDQRASVLETANEIRSANRTPPYVSLMVGDKVRFVDDLAFRAQAPCHNTDTRPSVVPAGTVGEVTMVKMKHGKVHHVRVKVGIPIAFLGTHSHYEAEEVYVQVGPKSPLKRLNLRPGDAARLTTDIDWGDQARLHPGIIWGGRRRDRVEVLKVLPGAIVLVRLTHPSGLQTQRLVTLTSLELDNPLC